jgi:hypothetical protein
VLAFKDRKKRVMLKTSQQQSRAEQAFLDLGSATA